VAMRPRSPADLAGVFGIGQARTDKYGAGFLAVIASVPDGPGAAG